MGFDFPSFRSRDLSPERYLSPSRSFALIGRPLGGPVHPRRILRGRHYPVSVSVDTRAQHSTLRALPQGGAAIRPPRGKLPFPAATCHRAFHSSGGSPVPPSTLQEGSSMTCRRRSRKAHAGGLGRRGPWACLYETKYTRGDSPSTGTPLRSGPGPALPHHRQGPRS